MSDGSLLGSAKREAMVPYDPAHWHDLLRRVREPSVVDMLDDALAETLLTTEPALTRSVLVDGRPEFLLGLYTLSDHAVPWVYTVTPIVDRLARGILASRPFAAECLAVRPVLLAKRRSLDGAADLWFAAAGFHNVGEGRAGRWEMRRADVDN